MKLLLNRVRIHGTQHVTPLNSMPLGVYYAAFYQQITFSASTVQNILLFVTELTGLIMINKGFNSIFFQL